MADTVIFNKPIDYYLKLGVDHIFIYDHNDPK